MDKQDLEIQEILHNKVSELIDEVNSKVIERDELTKLLILSIFSGSHIFLIGRPGTGKTYLINIILNSIKNAKTFEYLVMDQTKPEEIFGTVVTDAQGNMSYNYENSVLDSHFVMLDEMFKGQSAILNALLGVTSNERTFSMRGRGMVKVPLITMFGASNEFPSDDALEPFDDRLLLRYDVERIKDPENYKRLIAGDFDTSSEIKTEVFLKDIEMSQIFSKQLIRIPDNIIEIYSLLKQKIIQDRIKVSDRKLVTTVNKILKTSAYLNKRDYINYSDLIILVHVAWHDYTDKVKIREIIFNTLFGTQKTFVNQLTKIEQDLLDLDNSYQKDIRDFINRQVPMNPRNFEHIYYAHMAKIDQFVKVLQVLDTNLAEIEEKMNFNNMLEEEIQNNMFLTEYKSDVFDDEVLDIMQKERSEINHHKYLIEAFIDSAKDPYIYYQSTGDAE